MVLDWRRWCWHGEGGVGMEKVVLDCWTGEGGVGLLAWRRWWCVHGQWRIVFYHACSQLDFLCSNALHALTLGGHLEELWILH